jgi:preprotein translocase subunit SecY
MPIKVNLSGVLPIIFASSILSLPSTITMFWTPEQGSFWAGFFNFFNSTSWGYAVLYFVLIILFAYFYASIQYNPVEMANNLRQNSGAIPGIRPGKPTSDYLDDVLNYIVFIGACGLIIVCLVPIIASGLFNVGSLSFGGTSLIIVAGVVLETIKQIESMMLVRNYKGFLND